MIGVIDVAVFLTLTAQLMAAAYALRGGPAATSRLRLVAFAFVASAAVTLLGWERGRTDTTFGWELAFFGAGSLLVAAGLSDVGLAAGRAATSAARLLSRLEAAFRQAPDALLVCTPQGVVVDCNLAAEAVVARPRSELRGRRLAEVIAIPDDDPDRIERSLAERLRGELEGAREYRVETEAGQTFWLEVDSRPLAAGGQAFLLVSARDVTERRKTEARIRRARTRFGLLVDALPVLAWTTDRDLRVTSVRGKGLESLGLRAADIEGRTLPEIYAKLDLPAPLVPQHPRALAGETLPLTWQVRGLLFEGALAGVRGPGGEVVEAVGIALDVTGRERARSQAGESEKTLYAILDQAPATVFIKDTAGRYLWVNHHWERLNRRSRADTVFKTDADLFPRALAKAFLANDQEVFSKGEPMSFVERVAGSPQPRSYLTTKFLLRDEQGQPYAICGIAIDETDRIEMQAELLHRDAMLDEAQSMAGLASWEWDLQTNRHYWGPHFHEMLDIDPDDPDPQAAYASGIVEEDRPRVLALVQAALQDDVPYAADYRVRRRDGEVRWIHAQGRVERNAAGEHIRFFGFAQDVTDVRAAAAKLLGFNAQLEARVAERAEQLELTIAELDSFSYAVSHDLRQPLRTISGYLSIMNEDRGLLGEAARYLDLVASAVRRMDGIIADLLALSRVSHGKLNRCWVDLSDTALRIAQDLAAGEQQRQVVWSIEAGLRVFADRDLVEVVLVNLLGNAFKFTGARPLAHIEVGRTIEAGEEVLFVRDDGAGFDPAFAVHLFEPFRRLHSAGEFEGNGIGLATVARIVRRHGGWIRAEGRPNKGATIRFTLPPKLAESGGARP